MGPECEEDSPLVPAKRRPISFSWASQSISIGPVSLAARQPDSTLVFGRLFTSLRFQHAPPSRLHQRICGPELCNN